MADLFFFYFATKDLMTSLSDDRQTDIIEAFNSTNRYLDDLLNIDNPNFEDMVNQVYPPVLRLKKADTYATEDPFLDLNFFVSKGCFLQNL